MISVEFNFLSGSSGDGILERSARESGPHNIIRKNTPVTNDGCDINDTSEPIFVVNTWERNRFRTQCGAAAD